MKKTILALCIGLIIGLSSNAFAAIGDKVEAVFAEFVFIVDGEKKELDASPLVYNGTSYLPVRTVANLVGKDVTFKSDTRTIELATPIETKAVIESMNTLDIIGDLEGVTQQITLEIDHISRLEKSVYQYEKLEKEALAGSGNEIALEAIRDNLTFTKEELVKARVHLSELEAKKAELQAQQ